MIQIRQIVNEYQHSCTYILYNDDCEFAWLIDCGSDIQKVLEWLKTNDKRLRGIFLTHCHDDHICGLRQLLIEHPCVPIYLSAHEGVMCVQDIRMNLTKYTSTPFRVISDYFVELEDKAKVSIFNDVELIAYLADGHSLDSMVYRVGDNLFTGDAYIPPLKVVTRLPGADKARAVQSLKMIQELIVNDNLNVLPGHDISHLNIK